MNGINATAGRLSAITDLEQIDRQVERFRRALSSTEINTRKVGNRSHTDPCSVHVHRDLGFWAVLEDGRAKTWHVFGRIDDRFENERSTLGHVCQINFSYSGNTRVAGMFAADARGRVFVTHSGGIGGGRTGIGKSGFQEYVVEHSGLSVADLDLGDGSRITQFVLGELNTPSFRRRIADFVHLVDQFKHYARSGVETVARPIIIIGKRGQGYERDPAVRQAVEMHAMDVVKRHYVNKRYAVRRVSHRPGELDLRCSKRGVEVWVEVKGTTGEGDSVELTDAEVRRSRDRGVTVHLAVVSGIRVDRSEQPPHASGGTLFIYKRFDPDQHISLVPTKYRCTLDHSHGEPA